jgi:hypothetical protein
LLKNEQKRAKIEVHLFPDEVHLVPEEVHLIPGEVHLIAGEVHLIPGEVHLVTELGAPSQDGAWLQPQSGWCLAPSEDMTWSQAPACGRSQAPCLKENDERERVNLRVRGDEMR